MLIRADKLVFDARQSTGLSVARHATQEHSQANKDAVKLPKLDLPSFSGSYTAWTSFWDLFNTSIHANATLTDGQKLRYLKASVTGEPSRLVAALEVADANYPAARKILTGIYDNQRSIVRPHVAALINYPTIKIESASALRKLQCEVNEYILALEARGVKTTKNDPLTAHLVADKLDSESKKQSELDSSATKLETLDEFLEFIDQRARAFEAEPKLEKTPNPATSRQPQACKNVKYHAQTVSCPMCDTGEHRLYNCPKTFL